MSTIVSVLPSGVLDSLLLKFNEATGNNEGRELRFLRLPHPRTDVSSLFLPYYVSGKSRLLEVQAVSPPNARSWFLSEGEVIEDGQLLVLTPIDPAFLLIPLLRLTETLGGTAGSFCPADDIFEEVRSRILNGGTGAQDAIRDVSSNDLTHFFSLDCVKLAMKRVCEVKEITPEITVYRYSRAQSLTLMKAKVARVHTPEIFEASRTLVRNLAKDGLMEDGKEALLQAGRLKAACELVSQYLSKDMCDELLASYDFAALDAYHAELRSEHASAAASKMNAVEAKESKTSVVEPETGKKRKGATKASHGVEKLKKVNTKGMAKLSSFFQKS
ncbi:ribonuclease H2, subunit B [Cristinia sonorae]|uniref:Ribonuclease H2 subunit B n=1 Tax=Cristinia sonorae TaxID=1940300 RepID=A0A8K0V060_9AGAR|nr:ribonuclease H2, subunit B [Cristinia sonorae]